MQLKSLSLLCLSIASAHALPYNSFMDNSLLSIARARIESQESVGQHYDMYPQLVVALKGGIITRNEKDGSTTNVQFPTGRPVYRPSESEDKMHSSTNNQAEPIDLLMIHIKNAPALIGLASLLGMGMAAGAWRLFAKK